MVKRKRTSNVQGAPQSSHVDTLNVSSRTLPDYLRVSDRQFKLMLSKVVADGHQIMQWLDTDDKMKSVRRLTNSVNALCYYKLQQQLWNDYYRIGLESNTWAPRIMKHVAREHNTCVTYGRPAKLITQRRKTIEHQLMRSMSDLQEQLVSLPKWTDDVTPSISSNFLSTAIESLVRKGQHRLRNEFEHKQAMLKWDAQDHQCITAFYALHPNDEQVIV